MTVHKTHLTGDEMTTFYVTFRDEGKCNIVEYEVDAAGPVEAVEAAYDQFIEDDFLPEEVWLVNCTRQEDE
jgi:hypothetical protein